ncbi:MAG: protochlorophyllide oxidoreductase [Cyanothece sp. SIO1E1]|nr:protochlorophyllide oxidoreductase [Cyanothece sp. SIO1E1]
MEKFDLVDPLEWTPAAAAKLKQIPFFARSQARICIEQLARETGIEIITIELVEQARLQFGQQGTNPQSPHFDLEAVDSAADQNQVQ